MYNSGNNRLRQVRKFTRALISQRVELGVINRQLSDIDLSIDLWMILDTLSERSRRASSIGAETGLSAVQVSRGVKELAEYGYLVAHKDDTDRRATIVDLTERGAQVHYDALSLFEVQRSSGRNMRGKGMALADVVSNVNELLSNWRTSSR